MRYMYNYLRSTAFMLKLFQVGAGVSTAIPIQPAQGPQVKAKGSQISDPKQLSLFMQCHPTQPLKRTVVVVVKASVPVMIWQQPGPSVVH